MEKNNVDKKVDGNNNSLIVIVVCVTVFICLFVFIISMFRGKATSNAELNKMIDQIYEAEVKYIMSFDEGHVTGFTGTVSTDELASGGYMSQLDEVNGNKCEGSAESRILAPAAEMDDVPVSIKVSVKCGSANKERTYEKTIGELRK